MFRIRYISVFGDDGNLRYYLPPIFPSPRCHFSRGFHIRVDESIPYSRSTGSWVLPTVSSVRLMSSTFLGVELFFSAFAVLLIRSIVRTASSPVSPLWYLCYLCPLSHFFARHLHPSFILGLYCDEYFGVCWWIHKILWFFDQYENVNWSLLPTSLAWFVVKVFFPS